MLPALIPEEQVDRVLGEMEKLDQQQVKQVLQIVVVVGVGQD